MAKSEKFEPKVRNLLEEWPKVTNSSQSENWRLRADKVRNSIFNVYLSEKFARELKLRVEFCHLQMFLLHKTLQIIFFWAIIL